MLSRVQGVLILALGLLLSGCGGSGKDQPKPVKVSGEVLLDGKPMKEGEISFVSPGNAPEVLPISDGRFEGDVLPGDKKVEIYAYRPGKWGETATIKTGDPPKENYLPERYNTKSDMKAKVSDSGLTPAKFDVTTK